MVNLHNAHNLFWAQSNDMRVPIFSNWNFILHCLKICDWIHGNVYGSYMIFQFFCPNFFVFFLREYPTEIFWERRIVVLWVSRAPNLNLFLFLYLFRKFGVFWTGPQRYLVPQWISLQGRVNFLFIWLFVHVVGTWWVLY